MTPNALFPIVVLFLAAAAGAEEKRAVLPVTADTGVTSVRGKYLYSNGTGPSTPIMQNQNWSGFENKNLLMAFDTRAIRGWTVARANLHVHVARGNLWAIGLCTVLADWPEGTARNGVERSGAPCWAFARTPRRGARPTAANYWAWPGSQLPTVAWFHPAARYSHAGAGQIKRSKTEDGRFLHLIVPVDPKVVEAMATGAAAGIVLTDDKGQVREGRSLVGTGRPYKYNAAEEAWVFTREIHQPSYRPWLEVFGDAIDKTPPAAPRDLRVTKTMPSDAAIMLEFTAPGDDGMTGEVLAYEAALSSGPITAGNWAKATPLPRYLLPRPVGGGKTQRMPVFAVAPGRYHLAVRGVDEAGNRGAAADLAVTIPTPPPARLAPVADAPPRPGRRPLKRAGFPGDLSLAAISDLVKADPVSGLLLSDGRKFRKDLPAAAARLWDAGGRTVSLRAAANEVVAWQLVLGRSEGALTGVKVSVGDLTGPAGRKIPADPNARCFRLWYVDGSGGAAGTGGSGWYPTACLPLAEPFSESFDLPAKDNGVPGQRFQSVWVDLYVPRGTGPGRYSGTVTVTARELAAPASVKLTLDVLPLSLPDRLNWFVELNRYHTPLRHAGLVGRKPEDLIQAKLEYYRQAHRHRCVLNVLPYSQSSATNADYTPLMAGAGTDVSVKDWTEWDRHFAGLLDGTAFAAGRGYAGPGAGVPINHMYLVIHENWPVRLNRRTYRDYAALTTRRQYVEWAKTSRPLAETVSPEYRRGFVRVTRQFFEHFKAKGWTRTAFQFYNNNKYYFRVGFFGGMGRRGTGNFFLMDEPTDHDDYLANAFIMKLARRGYLAADAPKVRVHFRTDVSAPHMTRTYWDNVCTCWCVNGLQRFPTLAWARRLWLPGERHWGYAGGAGVADALVTNMKVSLRSWCVGSESHMLYYNNYGGGSGAWKRPNSLAIVYSGKNYAGTGRNYPGPIDTVRLKGIRRVVQDIEYLHLLAASPGWDRSGVRAALKAYADDPGAPALSFGRLTLARMLELRRRVAATLMAPKN